MTYALVLRTNTGREMTKATIPTLDPFEVSRALKRIGATSPVKVGDHICVEEVK